jgi:hypothetical protein
MKGTEQRWLKACGDHRLPKIKATRHKFIAHVGEPDKEDENPSYKELLDFARETAAIMEGLAVAVGFSMIGGLAGETEKFRSGAGKFWDPWSDNNGGL